MIVLDSSIVLAFLFDEPGGEQLGGLLETAAICAVNASEVVAKQIDRGSEAIIAEERFRRLDLAVQPFDSELALLAGTLRSATRHKGLSLGDRACLALAIRENGTAVTADRKWADLDLGCTIEVIR